jgi:hypothetical protein
MPTAKHVEENVVIKVDSSKSTRNVTIDSSTISHSTNDTRAIENLKLVYNTNLTSCGGGNNSDVESLKAKKQKKHNNHHLNVDDKEGSVTSNKSETGDKDSKDSSSKKSSSSSSKHKKSKKHKHKHKHRSSSKKRSASPNMIPLATTTA